MANRCHRHPRLIPVVRCFISFIGMGILSRRQSDRYRQRAKCIVIPLNHKWGACGALTQLNFTGDAILAKLSKEMTTNVIIEALGCLTPVATGDNLPACREDRFDNIEQHVVLVVERTKPKTQTGRIASNSTGGPGFAEVTNHTHLTIKMYPPIP